MASCHRASAQNVLATQTVNSLRASHVGGSLTFRRTCGRSTSVTFTVWRFQITCTGSSSSTHSSNRPVSGASQTSSIDTSTVIVWFSGLLHTNSTRDPSTMLSARPLSSTTTRQANDPPTNATAGQSWSCNRNAPTTGTFTGSACDLGTIAHARTLHCNSSTGPANRSLPSNSMCLPITVNATSRDQKCRKTKSATHLNERPSSPTSTSEIGRSCEWNELAASCPQYLHFEFNPSGLTGGLLGFKLHSRATRNRFPRSSHRFSNSMFRDRNFRLDRSSAGRLQPVNKCAAANVIDVLLTGRGVLRSVSYGESARIGRFSLRSNANGCGLDRILTIGKSITRPQKRLRGARSVSFET